MDKVLNVIFYDRNDYVLWLTLTADMTREEAERMADIMGYKEN